MWLKNLFKRRKKQEKDPKEGESILTYFLNETEDEEND